MLKMTLDEIRREEARYPGITQDVLRFEKASLPPCPLCASADTADVQVGITGRTITLLAATTKVRLIPNAPRPGRYFCNACRRTFTPTSKGGDDAVIQ